MKKLVIALVMALFLLTGMAVHAEDEFGMGYIWVHSAHSDSDQFSMGNNNSDGWGISMHFDKDFGWKSELSKNNIIGLNPGIEADYIRWTKTKNGWQEKCKAYRYEKTETLGVGNNCWGCENEKYERSSNHVDSFFAFATLKPYWQIYNDFKLFGKGGAGYELSDGSKDDFAVTFGGGLQYQWTPGFVLSAEWSEIYTNPGGDYKRWDTAMFKAVMWF